MPCLSKADKASLATAIYYCKRAELIALCQYHHLSVTGTKQVLINRLLTDCGITDTAPKPVPPDISAIAETGPAHALSPVAYILPNHYTNGRKTRERFQQLIGKHFRFTSYGMDWIRACWAAGRYPRYEEFAAYWQGEYERRQAGGNFTSAPTNARVRFFRDPAHRGMSTNALNEAWKQKQASASKQVFSLLDVPPID